VNKEHEAYDRRLTEAIRLSEAERKADTDRLDEALSQEIADRQKADESIEELIRVQDVAHKHAMAVCLACLSCKCFVSECQCISIFFDILYCVFYTA
jgi:hypothetical protein